MQARGFSLEDLRLWCHAGGIFHCIFDDAMIPPRPQANDNHNPSAACERQIGEVKRRFVARIACAARGGQGSPFAAASDRSVPEPTQDL